MSKLKEDLEQGSQIIRYSTPDGWEHGKMITVDYALECANSYVERNAKVEFHYVFAVCKPYLPEEVTKRLMEHGASL